MARNKSKFPRMGKLRLMMAEIYISANGPVSNKTIEEGIMRNMLEKNDQINLDNITKSELSKFRDNCNSTRQNLQDRGNIERVVRNKWKITDKGIQVFNFVQNVSDIAKNFMYLEDIRKNSKGTDYDMFKELIEGGSTFIKFLSKDGVFFAPSKFMGYKNNNFQVHNQYKKERDGKLTDPIIDSIIGKREDDPMKGENPIIEQEFVKFCKQNGLNHNYKNKAGKRTFWNLENFTNKVQTNLEEEIVDDSVVAQKRIKEMDQLDYKGTTNLILYGPPGTSKTYDSVEKAVKLCINSETEKQTDWDNREEVINLYKTLSIIGRIKFVTFHQSLSYEEFVEGLRPTVDKNNISGGFSLEPKDGIFKELCNRAKKNQFWIQIEQFFKLE